MNNVIDLQLLARWGSGTIEEIAWSPDGNWLAAGGSIGVHIYDSHSLEVVTFVETDYGVNSIAFSPDGTLLAAGMADNSIRLWQTANWAPLRIITGHTGPVLSIAFAPDGSMLASGSEDYTICLWRIPGGELVRTFNQPTEPVTQVKYSPDGNTLATITGDGQARLWGVSSGTYLHSLSSANSISYSPDSALLATGSWGNIEVWGVADGAFISAIGSGWGNSLVTFSPTGTTLAAASDLYLYVVSITGTTATISWQGHNDFVSSLAFSPDGTRLASAALDGSLKLWQVSDQTLLGAIEGHSSHLTSMTLTRNGAYMATGFSRGTIQIRFPTNGRIWQEWADPTGDNLAVTDLEYSPNGTILASLSSYIYNLPNDYAYFSSNDAKLWNPSNGALLNVVAEDGNDIAFSPDGMELMVGGNYFSRDGVLLDQLEYRRGNNSVSSVEFSPDGTILAVGVGGLRLFRTPDLELLRVLVEGEGTSLAFSPDGTILAAGGGNTIQLWRVSDRMLLRTLSGHTSYVISLAFSSDGTMLVSGSDDRTVRLWRVGDGALLHTLSGHNFQVVDVAFSPDSTLLYSASLDGTLRVWGIFLSWRQER
jgi:WD40 repeat protein